MERDFFLTKKELDFPNGKMMTLRWQKYSGETPDVTKFICTSGRFSTQDIVNRLDIEIKNRAEYHVQYWPIFELTSNELMSKTI